MFKVLIINTLPLQCFIFLDDAQGVADILENLIKDNEASTLSLVLVFWIGY